MDGFSTIVRFFQEGGLFMYFILLLFAVGLAIAIERFIYLTAARSKSRKTWDSLVPLIQQGNYDQASDLVSKSKATIAHMLAYGLARFREHTKHRDEIETAMPVAICETQFQGMAPGRHYLALISYGGPVVVQTGR